MIDFLVLFSASYFLIVVTTFCLSDRYFNRLANNVSRSNKISAKNRLALSLIVSLLPALWMAMLCLATRSPYHLGAFVTLSIFFAAVTLIEIVLRIAGNKPNLEIDLFETSFETWSQLEPLLGKKYVTVDFHDQYKFHYRNYKPKLIGNFLVASGSEQGDIAVVNNFRLTVGCPRVFNSTIHLLGGSTTFCAESPNELTYASILQGLLNEKYKDIRVLNYGFSGATLPRLVERIEQSEVKNGDLVIAYMGINEAAHLMIEKTKVMVKFVRLIPRYDELMSVFAQKSLVAEWLKSATVKQHWKMNIAGVAALENGVGRLVAHCNKSGASLIFILQPSLFTKKLSSNYENNLLKNVNFEFRRLIKICYERIDEMLQAKTSQKVAFNSAIALMDDCETSPYMDTFHVNDSGNQIIAEFIFDLVKGLR